MYMFIFRRIIWFSEMTLLKFFITCCLLTITCSQETEDAVPHQLKGKRMETQA